MAKTVKSVNVGERVALITSEKAQLERAPMFVNGRLNQEIGEYAVNLVDALAEQYGLSEDEKDTAKRIAITNLQRGTGGGE